MIARTPVIEAARTVADRVLRHRPLLFWWLYLRSLWGQPTRLSLQLVREFRDVGAVRRAAVPDRLIPLNGTSDAARARLAAVRCPVLLIWGSRDYVLPPETMTTYADRLSAATVRAVRMDDVGHYPPIEVPDRFVAVAAPFLAEVAAAV